MRRGRVPDVQAVSVPSQTTPPQNRKRFLFSMQHHGAPRFARRSMRALDNIATQSVRCAIRQ
jgi:hypothetical protein